MPPKANKTENSDGMMYVAGLNKYNQIYFKSNNRNSHGINVISPPVVRNLQTSDCLSFSTFGSHSVTIMDNEPSATIGPFTGNKRVLINKGRIKKWTRIAIEENDQNYKLISAVCGSEYTLYLLKSSTAVDDLPRLAYCSEGENHELPLLLNTKNYVPIALYGGCHFSAAITEEGGILIVDPSVFTSDDHCPKYELLPDNEKAIQLAFLNKFVYALSSTGKVYKSNNQNKSESFKRVMCLKDYNIVQISGSKNHILAVTSDGKVLSHGQNRHGQLGVGKTVASSTKFEIIESLKDFEITAAYAGNNHSLFQTSAGAVLSCGSNAYGQLLLADTNPNDKITYEPKQTIIEEGATFCIAGGGLSCVYVSCKPPPKSPNMIIEKIETPFKPKPLKQPDQEPEAEAEPEPENPVQPKQPDQEPEPEPEPEPEKSAQSRQAPSQSKVQKLKELLDLQSQIREMKGNVEIKNNQINQLRQENNSIIDFIDKILLKIDQYEKQKQNAKKQSNIVKIKDESDSDDDNEIVNISNKDETNQVNIDNGNKEENESDDDFDDNENDAKYAEEENKNFNDDEIVKKSNDDEMNQENIENGNKEENESDDDFDDNGDDAMFAEENKNSNHNEEEKENSFRENPEDNYNENESNNNNNNEGENFNENGIPHIEEEEYQNYSSDEGNP